MHKVSFSDIRSVVVFQVLLLLATSMGAHPSFAASPALTAEQMTASADAASTMGNADDAMSRLQQDVPGFGGLYLEKGGVYVYLTDLSVARVYQPLVSAFAALANPPQPSSAEAFDANNVHYIQADYDFNTLRSYKNLMSDSLSLPGAQALDADERLNRVVVYVDSASDVDAIVAFGSKHGVAAKALVVRVAPEKMRVAAGLQDFFRPSKGGNQVVSGFLLSPPDWCTQMMTVSLTSGFPGMRGFFTCSHCTATYGGVNSDNMWQPTTFYPQLAMEVFDVPFSSGVPGCPGGKICRFADTAFSGFVNSPYNGQGLVGQFHKTSTSCSLPTVYCGITIHPTQPTFTAVGAAPVAVVGSIRSKIGRTTGWTVGSATQTCMTEATGIGTKTLLCQDRYSMGVDNGDSGSYVFVQLGATTIQVAGILWGALGTNVAAVSPLGNFNSDVGMPTFTFF